MDVIIFIDISIVFGFDDHPNYLHYLPLLSSIILIIMFTYCNMILLPLLGTELSAERGEQRWRPRPTKAEDGSGGGLRRADLDGVMILRLWCRITKWREAVGTAGWSCTAVLPSVQMGYFF